LNLLLLSNPKIKLIVLKIIQNLIKIGLPFEHFEEAISQIDKNSESNLLSEIIRNGEIDVKGSRFISFIFNYLH